MRESDDDCDQPPPGLEPPPPPGEIDDADRKELFKALGTLMKRLDDLNHRCPNKDEHRSCMSHLQMVGDAIRRWV